MLSLPADGPPCSKSILTPSCCRARKPEKASNRPCRTAFLRKRIMKWSCLQGHYWSKRTGLKAHQMDPLLARCSAKSLFSPPLSNARKFQRDSACAWGRCNRYGNRRRSQTMNRLWRIPWEFSVYWCRLEKWIGKVEWETVEWGVVQ